MANTKGKLTEEEKALRAELRAANPPKIYQITPNYRIVGKTECFVLEQRKISQKGEEKWEVLGYHTELGNAIISVSKHVTRDHIDELLFVASQLEDIKKLCIELNKEK